jgi:hypothetical protein
MKKLVAILFSILWITGLSACSTSAAPSTANSTGSNSKTLSTVEELVLGTLNLEGTSEAVDKIQAASLLPLWRAYVELQGNNSTASEEVNAVISQIEGAMTVEQMKAIGDLKLTSQDLMDTMASLGIDNAPVNPQGTRVASTGQDVIVGGQVDVGGGNPSAGGVPPSDGGMPQKGTGGPRGSSSGTTNLSQSQIATMQASSGTSQGAKGINALIEKLINGLQKTAQG